jgi:hypothetical protein
MARVSEVIRGWLGWCPSARTMRTAPVVLTTPPATVQPVQPGGGTGGSGRIGRGIGLAAGSIKLLFRNARLLWFSLLTGLVMSFSLATNLYIQLASGTNPIPGMAFITNSPGILIAKGSLMWFALTFTIGFISTFLTYYLLAGLIVCVSFILSGKTITLREGLSRAGDHIRPLAGWAVIGALLGTASNYITNSWTSSLSILILSMGVIFVFFVLTMFVVPAIVLDDKNILPAIRESLSVFRKTWGEIVTCFVMLLVIVFVIYLIALIPIIYIGFSNGSTALAGFAFILTMLAMIVIIIIGSTIVGIATLGLYMYGKTGILPPAFGENPGVNAPA